jgi:hypothetical protein
METQNVSSQLFHKQLPSDPNAGTYNCEPTYPYLSTCVDNVKTDANIENAFQKQLNLSEYYKSPGVFDSVKRDFMDQTMENENTPVVGVKPEPTPPPVPTKIPVGPTDFLNKFIKESFGSSDNILTILIILLFIVVLVFSFMNKFNNFAKIMQNPFGIHTNFH